ncbi:MAG: sulfatase-like hydrolase/transferase, partial [Rubripirellula sp.]
AQLYDLESDPFEKQNLADECLEVVGQLSELLTSWSPVTEQQVGVVRSPDGSGEETPKKTRKRQNRSRKMNGANAKDANAKTLGTESDVAEGQSLESRAQRPNILLLFADDQRNHTLGCAGHPIVKTPSIDRLASEGVRFSNAFVSTSTCWVSRACLFTGCYERRHLYRVGGGALDPKLCDTSYFTVLKNAGYRTGHLGKEHVSIDADSAAKMFDVRRKIGRRPYFKPQDDGTERHETQILGDWGVEFLREQPQGQPFCLTVSFNATHAEDGDRRPGIGHYPWPKVMNGRYDDVVVPPPALNDPAIYESQPEFLKQSINRQRYFWRWDTEQKYQTNMRAYFRMLSGIDHVVGRLVAQLDAQGLAENTVIIYTADNGYYLGDRGFAGKWTHYEQSLRVPLVVYDPRLPESKRGRVVEQFALNSDLASTMIEMAGERRPTSHTGQSLVPLTRGETPDDWRHDFLCEFIAVPTTIPRWEGVRDTDWVYARYYVAGPDRPPFEFLHDLKRDPNQLVNLAAVPAAQRNSSNQTALEAMRVRCDELVSHHGPAMKDLPEKRSKRNRRQAVPSAEK